MKKALMILCMTILLTSCSNSGGVVSNSTEPNDNTTTTTEITTTIASTIETEIVTTTLVEDANSTEPKAFEWKPPLIVHRIDNITYKMPYSFGDAIEMNTDELHKDYYYSSDYDKGLILVAVFHQTNTLNDAFVDSFLFHSLKDTGISVLDYSVNNHKNLYFTAISEGEEKTSYVRSIAFNSKEHFICCFITSYKNDEEAKELFDSFVECITFEDEQSDEKEIVETTTKTTTKHTTTDKPKESKTTKQTTTKKQTEAPKTTSIKQIEAPKDSTTTGQNNALKKANSYLSFSAFSRTGLISQLEYEGFSNADAQYAVDNCGANWSEQAAKKAKDYLNSSAFSRSGLINQLEYEGFTQNEAKYGTDASGADWNQQAAKKAQEYLNFMSFSRDELIGQLEYEGFTAEQAAYGASSVGY